MVGHHPLDDARSSRRQSARSSVIRVGYEPGPVSVGEASHVPLQRPDLKQQPRNIIVVDICCLFFVSVGVNLKLHVSLVPFILLVRYCLSIAETELKFSSIRIKIKFGFSCMPATRNPAHGTIFSFIKQAESCIPAAIALVHLEPLYTWTDSSHQTGRIFCCELSGFIPASMRSYFGSTVGNDVLCSGLYRSKSHNWS